MTYIEKLFINIIDEPVSNHSKALVPPDPHKLIHLGEPVWGGETQPVVDTRQISQIEDVVELGWGWG